jgi:MerR family transcriptional regulator, light-induced transcriptional regulator
MQEFSIRDIENLTGIKAHTLRIWEQRYSLLIPKRRESLHRIYSNDDLKHMLRVSYLYHSGWKVSKIAALDNDSIIEEVRKASDEKADNTFFMNQLIEAALDFDEYAFKAVLNNVIEQTGFENCIINVCYPYLVKVGHLWSTNNVIPAQEHFSSYIIQNRVIAETENLPARGIKPEILLMCPQGEYHELPLLFINYLMKKYEWGTLYLGPGINIDKLNAVSAIEGLDYIYIHMLTNFTGLEIDDYVESVCTGFPGKKIILSGNGFRSLQRRFTNLTVLSTDSMIIDFIKRNHYLGST